MFCAPAFAGWVPTSPARSWKLRPLRSRSRWAQTMTMTRMRSWVAILQADSVWRDDDLGWWTVFGMFSVGEPGEVWSFEQTLLVMIHDYGNGAWEDFFFRNHCLSQFGCFHFVGQEIWILGELWVFEGGRRSVTWGCRTAAVNYG